MTSFLHKLLKSNPDLPLENREAIVGLVVRLERQAKILTRLAVTACNRELTATECSFDLIAENLCREITGHLKRAGCRNIVGIDFSGDPRGAVVKIKVNDRSGDWFGGDDYIVVGTNG